ncbi:PAAR-like domain-containing protein [Vibrio jasicida]|uniref:PAAR-like domain-containing protein n=1 Tax=Vibrio jasicida TaxID=766224 RepID=UPI0003A9B275|nr:PAAR-like domain-containing protein [Vibrio jasicida]
MGVTVGANGLSIVHKGSGGEANATLPDVCLTKVGKPIVPIPYGNNAKSADLAGGTTTISMDGGNSVAIKGSTFSKSTGDAGGDKKGVASGTIEAEAKFISASPTVKFEGKGVCRLSDQMTMNKANTMCISGAQNPSVSVTEVQEGTYTLDIECRYPDGEPLANAKFKVFDGNNAEIGSGILDSNGRSSVSSLPPGECYVVYEEDSRKYEAKTSRGLNGHKYEWSDDELFAHCAKEKLPFWEPRSVDSVRSTWGVFDENLGSDKDFISLLATEVRAHFEYELTEKEANDISQNIALLFGTNDDYSVVANELIAQVAPIIDKNGVTLNLLHSIHEDESHNNILALLRQQGYGDSEKYLKELNWDDWTKLVSGQLDTILSKVVQRFDTLSKYASMKGYQVAYDTLQVQAKSANEVKAKLPDITASGMEKLQEKSSKLISNGAKPKVVNNFSNGQTTQSEKVSDVVHAERTLPVPFALELCYDDKEKTPVSNVPYKLTYSSGEVFEGLLNGKGVASVYGVPQHEVPKIEFGDRDKAAKAEADRPAQLDVLKEEIKKYADYLVKETIAYNATQPSPQKELLEELKAQTEEELNELRARKAELDSASTTEYVWEMAKSSIEGVGDGVTNYVPDFGEIGDYLDALDIDLSVLIYAITTGDIDELEEALKRVDRGALYLQEATEAMERLLLIISDQEIREYLLTIPQLYLEALPADEAVKYSLSLATQKGIDGAIVVGGTAAGTAAGGVGGPAMAVLLTGATTARSAGKAAEPLLKALNNVVVGKKHSKNNHKEKPEDDETELDKTCPICRDSKCKNRKRLKKGKGYTDRKGARHTKNMKKAKPGYPKTHAWYAGARTLAAHHVIPIEAVKDDPYFEKAFDNFNFDINTIDNLVTLPMTPELACELRVQCHYTNHDQGIALNEDLSAFDRLLTHEQNNNADKLNAFGGKLLSKKPFLAYPKAAEKLALEVLDLVKKGEFCNSGNPRKEFADEMKQKSKKILKYINDFSWTIDWDSRDYHPESTYGCSGAEKVEKQSFKDDKTLKRTKPCSYKRDHSLGKGKFNGKLELGK